MGLALAFKRVYRFYAPAMRKWLQTNYQPILLYVLGSYTGMYCYARGEAHERLTYYFMATLLAFWLARKLIFASNDRPHGD